MTLGTYWPRSRGQSFFGNPPLAGFLRLSRVVSRQESTDPHRHSADRTLSSPSGAPYVARRTCLTHQSARLEPGAALVPLMRVRLPAKRRLRFESCRNRAAEQRRRSIGMRPYRLQSASTARIQDRLRPLRRDPDRFASAGSSSSPGERSKGLWPRRIRLRIQPSQPSPNNNVTAMTV